MATPLPAPWRGRVLAETRWTLEFCRLLVDPVLLGSGVPRGAGRPVLVLPGFLAGDQTLALIATWLYRIGYRPHLCRFLLNTDCADRTLERLERTLVEVASAPTTASRWSDTVTEVTSHARSPLAAGAGVARHLIGHRPP